MQIAKRLFSQNCYLTGPAYKGKTVPPPETVAILQKHGFTDAMIAQIPWLPRPQLSPKHGRIEEVDATQVLAPFINDRRLFGSLRTMDIANGCKNQCDSCFADAYVPSRIFSALSLEQLFSDPRFLQLLQPGSLRIGSSGDITDHPQAVAIVRMLLDATIPLDIKRQRTKSSTFDNNNRHRIKVWINYRPHKEDRIQGLMDLALADPERLHLTISTPFNRSDTVNRRMVNFVERNRDLFAFKVNEDGIPYFLENGRIHVHDARNSLGLIMHGRMLSRERIGKRCIQFIRRDTGPTDFGNRGQVKPYLNADGLWGFVYGTLYESHTRRVFTLLARGTPVYEAFLDMPFHHDFPLPPFWSGGKGDGKQSYQKLSALREEAINSGCEMKPSVIVC